MTDSAKLIIVSFRLPYRFASVNSKLKTFPGVGGLVTALTSCFTNTEKALEGHKSLHWVGISDLSRKTFEKTCADKTVVRDSIVMHPIFLPALQKDKFYNGFCNATIWPLFLYFPSFVIYEQELFFEYEKVNEIVYGEILNIYEPGDTIWVHDYHWMLLPLKLRVALPTAKIGFFLHIPFPSFEVYRLLPKMWRKQVLNGLLGADVVGFQTEESSRYFCEAIENVLPEIPRENMNFFLNECPVKVGAFPISIDYERIDTTAKTPEVRKEIRRIHKRFDKSKLLLSVDRLDYTKAIFSRLESYALFLQQNPEFRERITYILLMVPSRESIFKYKENKKEIEALISRINGIHGTLNWTPIIYQYRSIDFKKLIGLYGACDIALIVPVRDGMNLVAKEYIASRSSTDGVLILSETAGAASELPQALLVSPNDRQEISDAILEALLMPNSEQKARMHKMQSHIQKYDVMAWATNFLNAIR